MQVYLDLFGIKIPTYGFMIALGVVVANILAVFIAKKSKLDFNDFIILEAYSFLGGFVGAKVLYLIVAYKEIQWDRIFEFRYFNELMLGGFVFYGGLIVGLAFVFLGGKIHKIDADLYIRNFVFLAPLIHCFGRIGCFCAGCCYGIPYDGVGAVVFPEGSYALPGIKLFPVQLVEAAGLLGIALVILFLQVRVGWQYTIETYLILYAILRFVLERYRYDDARGYFGVFSTSQWISIFLVVFVIGMLFWRKIHTVKKG